MLFTATSTPENEDMLQKTMLLSDPVIIKTNPNRHNIFYRKIERPPSQQTNDHLDEILDEICTKLSTDSSSYPLTIVYADTKVISYCYWFLDTKLGDQQYCKDDKIPENRIFAQYHQEYSEKMKNLIVTELCKANSTIRIVFATVALGLGLDAPHIRQVIHYKPPTSLEQYFQETGRAGRDGEASAAVLYYNNTDIRTNRPGMTKQMRDFCKSETTCLRKTLLSHFGWEVPIDTDKKECCSVCSPLTNPVECGSTLPQ